MAHKYSTRINLTFRSTISAIWRILLTERCKNNFARALSNLQEAYGLNSAKDVRVASFVGNEYRHWEECTPDIDEFRNRYLTLTEDFPLCRKALITAIAERWVSLYKEWYVALDIKKLT
jgi:hypothetical protein